MRKLLMSNSSQHVANISDATIRRFLLAQLSADQQSAFETELFTGSPLEHRARLVELELIDDYAAGRLGATERAGFHQKFLVTAARERKLEVSSALQRSLANGLVANQTSSSPSSLFNWPRLAWRMAFSILALAILLASVLVIRREPQIVRKVIPKRWRPSAVVTPTPQPAHHRANSSESPAHSDEPPSLPAHEAAPQMIIMRPAVTADHAPVFTRMQDGANAVRLELALERTESATFGIVVTSSSGEVVHNVPEIHVEHADRIDFDVQVERLKAGDYQVTLTRINGETSAVGTFYFRVQ